MEGNNELRLCQAEMIAALQLYIKHLMRPADVKVVSVIKDKDEWFVVKLTKED